METEEIRRRVYGIIEGLKSAYVDHPVMDSSTLRDELGLESLDVIDLVLQVETLFGIKVKPEEAAHAVTAGDFVAIVDQKLH